MNLEDINIKYNWSEWRDFPDPGKQDYIYAPFGYGVYQLKNKQTNDYVMFGRGKNLAYRMTSLLPKGSGTRNNTEKREYVLVNLKNVLYRTVACKTERETKIIEKELKELNIHIFNT